MTSIDDAAALALTHTRAQLTSEGLPGDLARVYMQHARLQAGQEPLPSWSPHEFEMRFLDIVQLLDVADEERSAGRDWQVAYRRAAELLEWLDHPALATADMPIALLGAACYQLAGYPARAQTLLRHVDWRSTSAPLLALLLRGDMPRLLFEAAEAASNARNITSVAAADPQLDSSEWYVFLSGQIASAVGVIAADFRWGDQDRVAAAHRKLAAASKALRSVGDPVAWLLVKLTAEVATLMRHSTLRGHLAELSSTLNSEGRAALEGYARQRFLDRRSQVWPSQARGLDRLALGTSFALCTPTGSGKTTVAEVALLTGLFSAPSDLGLAPLCIYIVPTRALAAEVESKLARALKPVGIGRPVTVTGLYGGTDWGPSDAWLAADEPTVLICTQEKAEALLRYFGGIITAALRLVVVDEAHEVTNHDGVANLSRGESRALRLETLVSRLKTAAPAECQFVAMSAVAETFDLALAQWMAGPSAQPVTSNYRSTRQVVGRLRCRDSRMVIVHDVLDSSPLQVTGMESRAAYVPDPFPDVPPATGYDGPEKALAPYALWAAAHLVASEAGGQPVLVSITTGVRNWAAWFEDLIVQWERDLPSFFSEPRGTERELWEAALDAMEDYFGAGSREGKLLRKGVIVHYGRMPGRLPRLLVQLVERRVVRFVLATSGLSQGVNLPFETILVPKLRRPDGPMTRREFWNLVGRAGRPGVSTEGRTLVLDHIDAENWQRRRFQQDYRTLAAPQTGAGAIPAFSPLAELMTLIRGRLGFGDDQESFLNWLEITAPVDLDEDAGDAVEALDALDGLIIANLVERPPLGDVSAEDWLRRSWASTFASVASTEERRLEEAYVRRGLAIESRVYPDADLRRSIYRTSLPPRDALRVAPVADELTAYLSGAERYHLWTAEAKLEWVLGAVGIIAAHPRFAPPDRVGSSARTWTEVMSWWLAKQIAPVQPRQTQIGPWYDFISTHFSYRFNWALSGILTTIQERTNPEVLPSFLPEDWSSTGLPWIALWLKDLIEWGTLEPVAAYLLARGGAHSRPEAEAAAAEYASTVRQDPLSPDEVRLWAIRWMEGSSTPSDERLPPEEIQVEVSEEYLALARETQVRVLPAVQGGDVVWLHPSGLRVANTPDLRLDPDWRRRFDFVLSVDNRTVRTSRY